MSRFEVTWRSRFTAALAWISLQCPRTTDTCISRYRQVGAVDFVICWISSAHCAVWRWKSAGAVAHFDGPGDSDRQVRSLPVRRRRRTCFVHQGSLLLFRYSRRPRFALQYCNIDGKYSKQVTVSYLSSEGLSKNAGFRLGDRILAVNNIPITTERQAMKLLSNTIGDVITVVERASRYAFYLI